MSTVIDLRKETPDVAKHIVSAINAMSNIKKEQINIQKSMMLDQIERDRNLKTRRAEKEQDLEFEQKKQKSMLDWFQPQQEQVTPTADNQLPAMSMEENQVGSVTEQPSRQQVQQQEQPVLIDGIEIPNPKVILSSEGKMTERLIVYNGLYKQALNGTLSEKGKKLMLKMIGLSDTEISEKAQENRDKQQVLNNATRLRQEFINRPEVKDYILTSTNVKAMDSLLKNALAGNMENKVALDQGLITMYNKLTDPQSVVRESEYARTSSNLPVVNAINGAILKVQKGGAGLTDKDREALVVGAKIILNERGKQYNNTLTSYKDIATEYNIPESIITEGKDYFNPYNIDGQDKNIQQFSSEDEARDADLSDGTPIIINGVKGTWRNDYGIHT